MNAADAWTVADPIACPICGRDACEDHLPPGPEAAPVRNPRARRAFIHAGDVMTTPAPAEIVQGLAAVGCISVLVSESGTGKTFFLLSVGAAVSDNVPVHGRRVRAGSVAYASFESDALGLRLRALRTQGHQLEHLYVLRGTDPLSPAVDRDRLETPSRGELDLGAALVALRESLAEQGRPPIVLVVVDTVRASMTGSEDSSESVAAFLRVVRRLLALVPDAAALLAHHAGWQDGDVQRKRERGSSAWRGNVDMTLFLEAGDYDADRGEAHLTLRTLKVREGEPLPPLHLIRRRVELPDAASADLRDGAVTSCVIERDRRSREDRESEQAAAAEAEHQQTDLAVLQAMRDNPTATSISRLRPYVGLRTDVVSDAVARILRAQFATEGKRGCAYTLTNAGLARLNGHPI